MDEHIAYYEALRTRDARFDGRLFVGVTSTGVYCRPVCPAKTPKVENCRFFPSAAAAQGAGFRPCFRCRPETTVHLGSWRGTANTVARGLALIQHGELDGDGASVEGLAERLGVGERQLRRLFQKHLGASPIAVAQTRRLLFAKQLVHETGLSMAEVALAAGFGSVRRFNEAFLAVLHRPPSAVRRSGRPASSAVSGITGVTVRLRYRPPYDWKAMLEHLRSRAVEGVEHVDGERYVRTVMLGKSVGTVDVAHLPDARSLAATVRFPSIQALPVIIATVQRAFDLAADVETIGSHLRRDPFLAPLVRARPGLRTPGAWDGFELATRAILGQQVSVEAARRLAGLLARSFGSQVETSGHSQAALRLIFPTARQIASADLDVMPIPAARKRALTAAARAALADPHVFEAHATLEETVANLRTIQGIGDWAAHYIALRAAHEPDAFPASDVGLLRAAAGSNGGRMSESALLDRAERWRPWRAYAAQHLWTVAATGAS